MSKNNQFGPDLFTDPKSFDSEGSGLFSTCWIFAGLANEISSRNDFIRMDVGKGDVIVQNFGNHLGAFINSCSHRHSQIHDEHRGNRALVCPYHGWAYDANGYPVGIPRHEEFPEVRANPARFGLTKVRIECAGTFIFVRLRGEGPDLRTFLGGAYEFLERVSYSLDHLLDERRSAIHANWKLVIENALEGYHVPLVHRNSLGAIAQFSREPDAVVDHLPESGHSYMVNAADSAWLRRWRSFKKDVGTWPFELDHYVHQLIFPNLTVTSFLGYSFHIQHFHPKAVNCTVVHSRIYSTRFDHQTIRGKQIIAAVFGENIEFTRKIFEEDRLACERVHAGSLQATGPGVLAGIMEQRISSFRETYIRHCRRS